MMQSRRINDPSFFSPLQLYKAIFNSEFISKAQALSIQQNPLQVHIRRINVLTVETVKTVETVETVVFLDCRFCGYCRTVPL